MLNRRAFLKTGSAATLLFNARGAICFPQSAPANGYAGAAVSFDERSLLIGGKRQLLSCGEVHYARSTRAMWPLLMDRSKALGINTISTYVFWNLHETARDQWDFSGDRDLGHFLDLAHEKGLSIFLRVGPYICAEWNFGGFPPYLRDEPGITIRTMNPAYNARVENYYKRLAQVVVPRLASKGGPVVLVQVENEYTNVAKRYGEEGQQYLRWIVDLATRVGFAAVPTTTCEGGAQGAIETSNGFNITPERIAAVRKSHPGTPLLWTELYPSWYRVWGGRIAPPRDASSMAGRILDFVSRGGSGWSYYMWQGGSNFGRTAMYLQTPTYDFHAPLDELGEVTATGVYLGRLHDVLVQHTAILLEGDRTEATVDGERTVTWKHGGETLILVQPKNDVETGDRGPFRNRTEHGRLVSATGAVLFDLDAEREAVKASFKTADWHTLPQPAAAAWQMHPEPLPAARADAGTRSAQPVEQLGLTHDETDYCWYSASVNVEAAATEHTLEIPYGGDLFYLYVDGKLADRTKLPLKEERGPITPADPAHPRIVVGEHNEEPNGYRHSFTLPALSAGTHRIDLLSCAVGMVKGDWQISSPMNFDRKGIWQGVLWNGKPLTGWTMRPGLHGEHLELASNPAAAGWVPVAAPASLCWYRTELQVPENTLAGASIFRLDAAGLGKGLLWVNGHGIGRHWLIASSNPDREPSQRYYHIPADWLRPVNHLVILEEQGGTPDRVALQARSESALSKRASS